MEVTEEPRHLEHVLEAITEGVVQIALGKIEAALRKPTLDSIHPGGASTLNRLMAVAAGSACVPLLHSAMAAATSARSLESIECFETFGIDELRARLPRFSSMLERWLDFGVEAMLQWRAHYLADRSVLTALADQVPLGELRDIEPLSQESHDRGRRPLLLHFDCGTRIVYKPRSGQPERFFFDVVAQLQDRVPSFIRQRTVPLVDCHDHTWMAWIEHRPTGSETLHREYFQRMGGLLAVAHALRVGDLHHENVIAHEGYPVLVDLEVVLQPELPWCTPRMRARDASVLGTGLLPQRAPGTGAGPSNMSGITLSATYLRETNGIGINDQGRIEIRKGHRIAPAPNSPFIQDPPASALPDLRASLTTGFDAYYAALSQAVRDPIFMAWIESRCAGIGLRSVLRETRHYAQIHGALHHPGVLTGEYNADDILAKLDLAYAKAPQLREVATAEKACLAAGDVPAFRTRSDSVDLYWRGETLVREFFKIDGRERLLSGLARIDDPDRERQKALIAESMGDFAAPRPLLPGAGATSAAPAEKQRGSKVTAAAAAIGDWLLAREHDGFWFQTEFSPRSGAVCPVAISDRLSDGRLGIALFFAALHAQGLEPYRAHAMRIFDDVVAETRAGRVPQTLGGHDGLGGHIFALCAAARLLEEPGYLSAAVRLLAAVPERIVEDRHLDLYAGSAGALLACLELAKLADCGAIEIAMACREHLLGQAQRNAHGIGWVNPIAPAGRHLLGMAHGSHGIALALARLDAESPDGRARAVLSDAFAHEIACFDERSETWPDLRKPAELALAHDREESWCNGASGIGLAYMAINELAPGSADYRDWGLRAIQTVASNLACRSPCLCHGTLGNAWLLHRFGHSIPGSSERIDSVIDQVIDDTHRDGVICGVQPNRALPGLMSGVAGVGYGLLQLISKVPLPDVLSLRIQ